MQALARSAATALRRSSASASSSVSAAAPRGTRSMSSGVSLEEEKKQMDLWRVITFAAIPACLAFTFYTVSHEEHHEGEKPERTYTNVRSKPFPWGEDALFTSKSHKHH